ncbi:hypothetical protein OE88DRAFT_1214209 [Heliocybe sulcata]|uniref:Uncharacterized protein n=1 Tax=Heliocybe sulcata TaxID=5364 RepID=A0A5C3MKP4_9AGAM|nr:hypothetical protein OE88DRAFT_1214209 [Heliocybe sulcata]
MAIRVIMYPRYHAPAILSRVIVRQPQSYHDSVTSCSSDRLSVKSVCGHPSAMVDCEGCGRSFTYPGYTQHLRKTRNPPCRAIYEAHESYMPGQKDTTTRTDTGQQVASTDLDSDPPAFAGDFFGSDYHPDDFENHAGDDVQWDMEAISTGDSDSSGLSDDEEAESHSWEPDPPAAPASSEPDVEMTAEEDVSGIHMTREQAAETLRKSAAVEHFPSNAAGKPLRHQDAALSEYHLYASQLRTPSADIWSPFSSRLDWEVARWAKLRGPGSTALTELLRIEAARRARAFIQDC